MTAVPSEFYAQVRAANGLMPIETYERLYLLATDRKPRSGVEVGTAHGASAIALTMGARTDGNNSFKLITIDPMSADRRRGEPSSRSKYGGVEDNAAIVRANFERAGLADAIELFVGTSVDFGQSGAVPDRIDLLVLDADGRIDRDLLLLHRQLAEGATIIIDDVEGGAKVTASDERTRWIDYKHMISASILAELCAVGMLREIERAGSTSFCELINKPLWTEKRITEIALAQYRDLVFTRIDKADLVKWAMAERDHFDEVVLGRRMLKAFGPAIRAMRAVKRRLAPGRRRKRA